MFQRFRARFGNGYEQLTGRSSMELFHDSSIQRHESTGRIAKAPTFLPTKSSYESSKTPQHPPFLKAPDAVVTVFFEVVLLFSVE